MEPCEPRTEPSGTVAQTGTAGPNRRNRNRNRTEPNRSFASVMSNLVCLPWPSWTCSISNPVTAYELAVWMILPVTAAGALAPLPPIPLTKTDRNSPGGVKCGAGGGCWYADLSFRWHGVKRLHSTHKARGLHAWIPTQAVHIGAVTPQTFRITLGHVEGLRSSLLGQTQVQTFLLGSQLGSLRRNCRFCRQNPRFRRPRLNCRFFRENPRFGRPRLNCRFFRENPRFGLCGTGALGLTFQVLPGTLNDAAQVIMMTLGHAAHIT